MAHVVGARYSPPLVARERVRIQCVVTQREEDEPESRGDVAHVVGARHSPPLVARERVRLDPVRPHPRTGQGLSRAGPAVHKVPAWFRSVVRVSPAPWRGRGPGPTVASHPWRSAVCGG